MNFMYIVQHVSFFPYIVTVVENHAKSRILQLYERSELRLL